MGWNITIPTHLVVDLLGPLLEGRKRGGFLAKFLVADLPIYKGLSQAALARALRTTPSNFNQKLKRGTFSVEELERIAAALDATYPSVSVLATPTQAPRCACTAMRSPRRSNAPPTFCKRFLSAPKKRSSVTNSVMA